MVRLEKHTNVCSLFVYSGIRSFVVFSFLCVRYIFPLESSSQLFNLDKLDPRHKRRKSSKWFARRMWIAIDSACFCCFPLLMLLPLFSVVPFFTLRITTPLTDPFIQRLPFFRDQCRIERDVSFQCIATPFKRKEKVEKTATFSTCSLSFHTKHTKKKTLRTSKDITSYSQRMKDDRWRDVESHSLSLFHAKGKKATLTTIDWAMVWIRLIGFVANKSR